MISCNLILLAAIVSIGVFGSEMWILKETDIDDINAFQRYAGRRVQRFPPRSPNFTSFLGWGGSD